MNDIDGKTLKEEGQRPVFRNMKKFIKNVGHYVSVEEVAPIQQTNVMRDRPWGRREDFLTNLLFDNCLYNPMPCPQKKPLEFGVLHSHYIIRSLKGIISKFQPR